MAIVLFAWLMNTRHHKLVTDASAHFREGQRATGSRRNCVPNPIIRLPTLIVTNVSKRVLQMQRLIMKTWQEMQMRAMLLQRF